ncbi:hypothetical protein A1O3_09399 [Capronia epimyces CBS 606.96]|uniref:Uncharacterized protein n=1 Tax=Capronia epimyces CBS 606.96 TaxID=1182542 RepID=W9XDE0_9EURO|nr:uncharacterized protein A1O3_09399 [Capronia epimyces CBS 606.96]EXJ78238.1 hypothetical protein A1O3_09399 [Capronia epimyces CBS 606.96]
MLFSRRTGLALLSASCWLMPSALAANITVYQPNVALLPSPPPAPGPAKDFEAIIEQFNRLGRSTVWNLVKKIRFEGDSGEPEGMVNLGEERYIVGENHYTNVTASYGKNVIINGTDRTPGAGYAHLAVYDAQGKRIADATLTAPGAIQYHIGGIDYDGERIWATIAQYRPNTTATIISVDPFTLNYQNITSYNDHLGGIVHDKQTNQLSTLNWGARNATTWNLNSGALRHPSSGFSQPLAVVRNPTFFIDYQDCKFLGHSRVYDYRAVMMCSGLATYPNNVTVGGVGIVDTETMVPLSELPLPMVSDLGMPITVNPFDVALVNGTMRLYFLPDQHNSTLYVYEPVQDSPYEY